MWSWGDGITSEWLGPYNSGNKISTEHGWSSMGGRYVKVKAIDDPNGDGDISDGTESDWSEPLSISLPRGRTIFGNTLFYKLFEKLPTNSIFYKILSMMLF